jgi:hypothetical protein
MIIIHFVPNVGLLEGGVRGLKKGMDGWMDGWTHMHGHMDRHRHKHTQYITDAHDARNGQEPLLIHLLNYKLARRNYSAL